MIGFIFSQNFLISSTTFAIPIIFASFAALISNKAGIVNLNIEGSMSVAAVCGTLVGHFTSSVLLGVLSAVVVGISMSMFLAFSALRLGTDSFLSGIALNTLASGLSVYILYSVLGVKGDSSAAASAVIPSLGIPFLKDIPVVGPLLFDQNMMFYVAVACAFGLSFLLDRTVLGTRIKATGYNPAAAVSVGIDINGTKTVALVFCGAFAGLGGAFLSMGYLSYFSNGMVAGRGFIGIAAEAMGRGNPWSTAFFAFLFGAVDYFSVGAQTVLSIPYELLNTLPYLMTIVALVIYAVLSKEKQGRGLRKALKKEETKNESVADRM